MDDSKIAAALKHFQGIKVLDVSTVKIQQVGAGKELLGKNINFGSLRPAVMINKTLFVSDKRPHPHTSLTA